MKTVEQYEAEHERLSLLMKDAQSGASSWEATARTIQGLREQETDALRARLSAAEAVIGAAQQVLETDDAMTIELRGLRGDAPCSCGCLERAETAMESMRAALLVYRGRE